MLSANLRYLELLKRTYPIIKNHSHEIGEKTYNYMFAENSDIRNLFNNTPPSQSERLIDTIILYATEVDNFELIFGKLDKIAHVHIQHHVENDYYPIMKKAFTQSLCDVLNLDKDDELVGAWSYGIAKLSQELIHIEDLIRKYTKEEKKVIEGFNEANDSNTNVY